MRKNILKNFVLLLIFGLGLSLSPLSAQNASQKFQQNLENLKTLYQEMSGTTVTLNFIKSKLQTTNENVKLWENVKAYHVNNNAKDLTYLNSLITSGNAKLNEKN